jgi:hypothetical protein
MSINVEVLDVQTSELVATEQVQAEVKDTDVTAAVTGAALKTDIRSWDSLPRGQVLQKTVNKTAELLARPGAIPRLYFSDTKSVARRTLEPDQLALKMQEILHTLGYYNGHPDGLIGPGTAQAIQAFQRDYDLNETGALDPLTTKKLLEFK